MSLAGAGARCATPETLPHDSRPATGCSAASRPPGRRCASHTRALNGLALGVAEVEAEKLAPAGLVHAVRVSTSCPALRLRRLLSVTR
jgi:hypothetical protein